ncbi:MAG: hypothetical protein IPG58_06655 [Acidobacteria bacterium]|nr:hypothetical protein [Acidobacteriota bacterium]
MSGQLHPRLFLPRAANSASVPNTELFLRPDLTAEGQLIQTFAKPYQSAG